jgi:hypothetical protein
MSKVELNTARQSGTLETDAAVLTANEALPPEEPPVTEASSPGSPIEEEEKRAISPRKLAANRANAQRSSGPKTAEGKAKSAQNAIKHGIFATRFLYGASAEDVAEMEAAIQEMRDYYQPVGKLEEMLVEKIVVECARYARILGLEEQELSRKHAFFGVGLDRFGRYSTSTNRALSRAMEDLARVQAARRARESAAAITSTDAKQPAAEGAVVGQSGS